MNDRRTLAIGVVLVLAGLVVGAAAFGLIPSIGAEDPDAESDFTANGTAENDSASDLNSTVETPETIDPSAYGARVELYDDDWHVGPIYAETATTGSERYTGLSNHESLDPWEGMLFVYDEPRDLTFVMRRMSFSIDIVYIDEQGCVTSAHAAPEPEEGEDGESEQHQHPGYGQYVLEVPMGVATDNGVDEGDPVRIEHDGTVLNGRGNCGASAD